MTVSSDESGIIVNAETVENQKICRADFHFLLQASDAPTLEIVGAMADGCCLIYEFQPSIVFLG